MNMKRISTSYLKSALCLAAVMALLLPVCLAQGAADDLTLRYGDRTFSPGEAAGPLVDAVREATGESPQISQADSCMFAGKDREYAFDGLILGCYPRGRDGGDVLETILVTDPALCTARGARVGMKREEITALYGAEGLRDYDQLIYTVTDGGAQVIFTFDLEDDSVISFMLYLNTAV